MATVFDEVGICGLRKAHFEQLLYYIEDRDRDEWYYGNKKQFEQRHEDLYEWVEAIIEYVNSEGIIIPKKRREND